MNNKQIKNYALIPAKLLSSRCIDKNWRNFISGNNLVTHLISIIPDDFFDSVILSTDKPDVVPYNNITIHYRDKSLATKESPVNDLISIIISDYKLSEDGYIWLLNPTSPFRKQEDFFKIKMILETENIASVISASEINPFIWRDNTPMFDTKYPRKNTQDFTTKYYMENGQFIVFRVREFLKSKTWHGDNTILYKQKSVMQFVDIDTEEDFLEAQAIGVAINEK